VSDAAERNSRWTGPGRLLASKGAPRGDRLNHEEPGRQDGQPATSPASGSDGERDGAACPIRLEARALEKSYRGRKVVKGLSLAVMAGEIVGLLGPNGAGKTTVFDMMVGLTVPDRGDVLLGSHVLTHLPMYLRARLGIGYLPQESSVFRRMTVQQNLMAILELLDLTQEERDERLETAIKDLGLDHVRTNKAFTLSGGERRRVEIARALLTRPHFLMLDEPFAGIDPIAVGDIQGIIRQLKRRSIGILLTDHNVQQTLSIADRAYIINDGTILEEGSPSYLAGSRLAREVYLGEEFRL
jgi:lipopolysaccharide export system ATP-binding protein